MIERTEKCFDIKPEQLAADTAYGSATNLNWLVNEKRIAPHIPVIEWSSLHLHSLATPLMPVSFGLSLRRHGNRAVEAAIANKQQTGTPAMLRPIDMPTLAYAQADQGGRADGAIM
jgi:hypothetical protein